MVVFCVSTAFNSRSSIAPIPPALTSTTFATLGLMDDHQGALWAATWQRGASAPFMAVLRRTPLRMVWRTITSFALMRTAAVRFGFLQSRGPPTWKGGKIAALAPAAGSPFHRYLTLPSNLGLGVDPYLFGLWRCTPSGWQRFAYGQWSDMAWRMGDRHPQPACPR